MYKPNVHHVLQGQYSNCVITVISCLCKVSKASREHYGIYAWFTIIFLQFRLLILLTFYDGRIAGADKVPPTQIPRRRIN